MQKPKVAIVHDFLVQHGGAEKTVEAIMEIFPDAPVYTSIYKPENFKGTGFEGKEVHTIGETKNKWLTKFPILAKYFTFLIPAAFENFDLSKYDIILSSSSAYAKGVTTNINQTHISYIHTPPRFLYGYSVESTQRNAWYYRPVVKYIDHFLRQWDFKAAQRPNFLLTNSKNVKKRIEKFYRRDATVIYPPVEMEHVSVKCEKNNMEQPYYYALGRLAAYKNFDLAIQACNLTGIPLKVMGAGPEEAKLKKMAKENVEFLGRVDDKTKHEVIENSLGFLFPTDDEDFGIVVVEAFSHGKPVLAHRSGGPIELIKENKFGMFFDNLSLEDLAAKLRNFDKKVRENKFECEKMKEFATHFSKERFQEEYKAFVYDKWNAHKQA